MPANDMAQILNEFMDVVNDQMYDYAFVYKATNSKKYSGKTSYVAEWKGDALGKGSSPSVHKNSLGQNTQRVQ